MKLTSDPLGYLLKRAQSALRSNMDAALATLDLTTPQYAALGELVKEQGLSNAELARRCFVTPQTMYQIVIGLERGALLERSPHPEHGRIQRVKPTAEGQALLEHAHSLVAEVEKRMTRELTQVEIEQACALLTKCYKGLESKDGA